MPKYKRKFRVLVVDDEATARKALSRLLTSEGYLVEVASDGLQALGLVETFGPDVVLTDIRMPLKSGLEFLDEALQLNPELNIIMMTAYASVDTAIDALKRGAYQYLTKPLNFDEVLHTLDGCLERLQLRRELAAVRTQVPSDTFIGECDAVTKMLELVDQIAPAKSSILVSGDSGSGKELVARRIHDFSPRADGPFVAVNCASLPASIIESELFGYEKGAFTGASHQKLGFFEAADGGTLFIDEVGDLPPETQVKLLRVLEAREIIRVGGVSPVAIDVRIVSATHRDLNQYVEEGRFREDLFYRLNVIQVDVPPLRDRGDDITALVHHFVAIYSAENDKIIQEVTSEAMERLMSHNWPGNVRELRNVVERAVVLCRGAIVGVEHLPMNLNEFEKRSPSVPGSSLEELERFAILETYRSVGGNTKEAANILGISQRKVQYKINEYSET